MRLLLPLLFLLVACGVPTTRTTEQLEADEILETAIRDAPGFGDSLISVRVVEVVSDIHRVDVVFEAGRGYSFNTMMLRMGIEQIMTDGYRAIFTSGVLVGAASIEARLGTSLKPIYTTQLKYSTASQIDWTDILPSEMSELWVVLQPGVPPEFQAAANQSIEDYRDAYCLALSGVKHLAVPYKPLIDGC